MNDSRPTVALVAHGIHDTGGMERSLYELVVRSSERYRFVVLAAELDERIRPLVDWRRIAVPMRPIPLKLIAFAASAGLRLRGPTLELHERAHAVRGDAGGLRRDRSDAGADPRHDRADGEVLRLHGAADLAGTGVGGDDREGAAVRAQRWWWRCR